jgi:xylan 1,4-beta-xylosidase
MLTFSPSPSPAPLRHPWRRLITVGRAYDLVRADLLDHLSSLQREIGYDYIRFHAIFHDDMKVVTRAADGSLRFHWHHVDKVYDALLARGLRPFVELNPMPAALAGGSDTMFHYKMNITPPRLWSEWGLLVESFARHLVERYGLAEVRTWFFEVWNEPNLGGFWSGTKEDYFRLYESSARALATVDSALRVGGPATSKAHWIAEFIAHCHARAIPLRFISTHLYPQDEQVAYPDRKDSPHAVGEFFADTVRSVRTVVAASPRPDLPIYWSEWNTQAAADAAQVTWGENVHVDNAYAGTFIARNCLALDTACDMFGYWVASDVFEEGGIPSAPLSCTYGLLTLHGFPKAAANAFRLLRRLDGERLEPAAGFVAPHSGAGAAVVACPAAGQVRALLWNHAHVELPPPAPWRETLRVPWASPAAPQVLSARVGPAGGSVYEAWCELGRPENLTTAQAAFLRARSEPVWTLASARLTGDGHAEIDVTLAAHELLYIEFSAAPAAVGKDERLATAEWADWDKKMGELSR